MNRTILISIGALIILALAGVWAYLLFSEEEPSLPDFGDLSGLFSGGGDGAPPATTSEPPATATTTPNSEQLVVESTLQQLTTRPTIGHRFVGSTSSPRIIYAEEGTGHIYSIDLTDNTETRLSNTTVAGASQALFSASGTAAAIVTNEGESSIGGLTNDMTLELRQMPVEMRAPFVRGESELLFLEVDDTRSVARSIDMYTLEEQVLFTLPFTQAAMAWMPTGSIHYTYPKAARDLPGYLYAANSNGLSPTGMDGFGLAALSGPDHFLVSKDEQLGGSYSSVAIEKTSGTETALPFVFLPEKCAFSQTDTTTLYCAAPFTANTESLPDQWYQGQMQFNDLLWQVNLESGEATLLVSFEDESGRIVDAVDVVVSETDSHLLFRNKNDNSLWLYELES